MFSILFCPAFVAPIPLRGRSISHFSRAWCTGLVLAGALTARLLADTGQPAAVLTLPQAIARAEALHPALSALRSGEEVALAQREQAEARPRPSLAIEVENFLGTGARRDLSSLETTVQVEQEVERGGKRERRRALATEQERVWRAEGEVLRSQVREAVVVAYLEVVAAEARRTLAEEPKRLAGELLAAVEKQRELGQAGGAELARARATLAAAEQVRTQREGEVALARRALARLWGDDAGETFRVSGALQGVGESLSRTEVERLLEAHPLREWVAAQRGREEATWRLEQAEAVPNLAVTGGLRFLREGSDAAWVAGVSVPLSGPKAKQGTLRLARARVLQAEANGRAQWQEWAADTAQLWATLQLAEAALARIRRELLPPTEEALQAVMQAHAAGELPLLDVLEAQRANAEAQSAELEACIHYSLTLARLEARLAPTLPRTLNLLSQP